MQSLEYSSLNRFFKDGGFFTSPAVSRVFEVEGVVSVLALHGLLVAALLGWIPAACLLVTPILYARYLLGGHEILHSPRGPKANFITRLMPFVQTPIILGYDQYRDIHLRHHKYLGSDKDPEDYLVAAKSRLHALALAFVAPERAYLVWLRDKGMSKRLFVETLVRAGLFALYAWMNPWVFAVYLVIMRAAVCGSELFFHNILHMSDLQQRDAWVHHKALRLWWSMLRVLIGWEKVDILLVHDMHHYHQLVAAHRPAEAAEIVASRDVAETSNPTVAA